MSEPTTDSRYQSRSYIRSRNAYRMQCTFEYFISILVSDAYLAKLLTDMGFSDTTTGIISSLVTAAFLFQLAAIYLVTKIKNTKKTCVLSNSVSQVLFISLYIVPFLPLPRIVKTVIVITFLLLAYFTTYAVSSILFKWCNGFVDPEKRASFSAGKEMISLISGMAFTLVVGKIIDRFEANGNLHGGFLFIAAAGFILAICNFISLFLVEKDARDGMPAESRPVPAPMKTVLAETVGKKDFRHVMVLTVLWDVARYITVGFLGTYKTKELLLTVGTVQIINIAGNLFRFFLSKPIGRYSDKYSYARGITLALTIAAVGFFCNIFTTPATWFFIIPFTVLYSVSFAGTNQNSSNIIYSYINADYFVQASAIKNAVGGCFGFAASLVGAKLLSIVQENGNTLFGMSVYGQQVLSAISFVLAAAAVLYSHFVIERQNILKQ